MCRKIFLLVLWGLSPFIVLGSAPVNGWTKSNSFSVTTDTCDLAAPTNFHVQAIGTTWVTLAWIPTVPGVDHRVKTFRSSDGLLVSNVVVPPFMSPSLTVNGLQPGETYYSTICAICPDGTDSKYKSITPDWDTIITELIVSGISSSQGNGSCGISMMGNYCEFPLTGAVSIYKVSHGNSSFGRQFNVRKTNNSNGDPVIRTIVTSESHPYVFRIDDKDGNSIGVVGKTFQVFFQDLLIASYELYEHLGVGRMIWTAGQTGYKIVRLTAGPNGLSEPPTGASRLRDESSEAQALQAFAAPNPFSDVLDVYLDQIAAEQVNLQLYNLSGQKVMDKQFAGGQDQYSLSTTGLSAGFYMLRIEADGVIQTLKVIKSE